MVSNGRSAAQVCEILTMVLRHREIKTVPPLPDGWRLLPVGGELKIEAADGTIYDAREMTLRQMAQDILDKTALATLKLTVCAEHAGRLVVIQITIQITVSSGQATAIGSGALTSLPAALASSSLSSSPPGQQHHWCRQRLTRPPTGRCSTKAARATVVEGSRAVRKRQSEVRKAEKEAARAILIPEKIEWLARRDEPGRQAGPGGQRKKGRPQSRVHEAGNHHQARLRRDHLARGSHKSGTTAEGQIRSQAPAEKIIVPFLDRIHPRFVPFGTNSLVAVAQGFFEFCLGRELEFIP